MRLPFWIACSVATAALTAGAGAVQRDTPTVRFAAPTDDTYVSGPTRLVVVVEPAPATREIRGVTVFADGQQVCTIPRPPFECNWDAGAGVVEHQIRAVATLRSGGRTTATVRTKGLEHAEAVNVDVVQLTPVVTDGNGRFVKGLTKSDFKVFEDDSPQPITHFAAENIPLEMVAAVDVSSSMREALPHVKASAKQFLSGLRPDDQVTVLGFNDNIFTLARRETDQTTREKAIDRMAPWGGTALYDVIIRSVDILGRQSGRRAIVLFSDGDDQSSRAPLDAAIKRTEGSDATIYAIGQGRAVRAPDLQQLMTQLSNVSGGRAFFTEDPGRLDTMFGEILEDLRNQYLLSYPAPSDQRDGKWHRIRVEVAGGKYKVRARQGYRLTRQ